METPNIMRGISLEPTHKHDKSTGQHMAYKLIFREYELHGAHS